MTRNERVLLLAIAKVLTNGYDMGVPARERSRIAALAEAVEQTEDRYPNAPEIDGDSIRR